jgi:hypothetical protein
MSAALRRAAPRLTTLWAIAALLCVLCPAPARAQGEGARAYELAPAGSQAVNVYGMFGRGNVSFDPGSGVLGGVEADVYGSIIEYAHGFSLRSKAGSLILSLPFGEARGSVNTSSAEHTDSRSGIGDMQITAAFGLVGSPALGDEDYETYRPRFALSLLTRVYVPTGAYEHNSPVNLGCLVLITSATPCSTPRLHRSRSSHR